MLQISIVSLVLLSPDLKKLPLQGAARIRSVAGGVSIPLPGHCMAHKSSENLCATQDEEDQTRSPKSIATRMPRSPGAGLTLDGSGHETTHVVTLQQQEQDQARDGHHHDAGLRGTVVDGAHRLLPQVGHRKRQGLLCAVG